METNNNARQNESGLALVLNQAINNITKQMLETHSFNVAVAELMKLANAIGKASQEDPLRERSLKSLIIMLSPMAPRAAEQLWNTLCSNLCCGNSSVHEQTWPTPVEEEGVTDDSVKIVIQIGGKKRGLLTIIDEGAGGLLDKEVLEFVKQDESIQKKLESLVVKREIVIRQKASKSYLVNFVV